MRDGDFIEDNLRLKQDAFFVGCERVGVTMTMLAARSGISIDTLRSYRPTRARPVPAIMGLAGFVKIAAALPPSHLHLASLLIEDSGCVVSRTDAQAAAWLALGERACEFGAKVMRYQASDDHIDHREDADLRADMIEILSAGHGVIGAGQGS